MVPVLGIGGVAASILLGSADFGEVEASRPAEAGPRFVANPPGKPIPPALGHHAAVIAGYTVTSDDEYLDVNDSVYDKNLRKVYGNERQKALRSIFSELGIFLPESQKSPHIPKLFDYENNQSCATVRATRGERDGALECARDAEQAAKDGNFLTPLIQARLTVLRFAIEHTVGSASK